MVLILRRQRGEGLSFLWLDSCLLPCYRLVCQSINAGPTNVAGNLWMEERGQEALRRAANRLSLPLVLSPPPGSRSPPAGQMVPWPVAASRADKASQPVRMNNSVSDTSRATAPGDVSLRR